MEKRKETAAVSSLILIKFLVERGSFAYRASVMASRILDLPLPVGPKMPNRPAEVSASKSMVCSFR